MSSIIAARRPALLAAPSIVHMSAYANTLTSFVPTLYAIMDIVSREMVGFLPMVDRNVNLSQRLAVGETVKWPKSPKFTTGNTPVGMAVSAAADRTPGEDTMSIDKAKTVGFNFTGEEQVGLDNSIGYSNLQTSEFAQALRAIVNEMEADLALAAALGASRAYGTAGTAPLASGTGDVAQLRKILDDNGAPLGPRGLVLNSDASANYRTNTQLTKANEAGDTMTLRDGSLGDIVGFNVHESGQLLGFTKGTGASATTDTAGYAIGATTITLASAGTGTIKAGDVVTFAGDANKYVVKTGDADVSNGGTIVLNEPGLRKALAASAIAITVGNSYTPNVGFTSDALRLLERAPAVPKEGDLRIDEYILVDPRSGMAFEVSVWAGQRMIKYEVSAVWGVKASKPEHIALLLG